MTKPPLVNQVWGRDRPGEGGAARGDAIQLQDPADFGTDDQGFDSIEIETPVQAVSVDTVILSHPDDPQRRDVLDVRDLAQVNATGFVIPLPAEYRRDQLSSGIGQSRSSFGPRCSPTAPSSWIACLTAPGRGRCASA